MSEGKCRYLTKRRAKWEDDLIRCERCGTYGWLPGQSFGVRLSLHHRRKRSQMPRWRKWEPSNCVMLCGDGVTGCHGWVEAHPRDASVDGWHVYPYQEPSETPVTLWTGLTVLLDDLGNYTPVDKVATHMDNG